VTGGKGEYAAIEMIIEGDATMRDVYICYESKDQEVAEFLCSLLESDEILCWLGCRDRETTGDLRNAEQEAIKKTLVTLLIWTPAAEHSKRIKRELGWSAEVYHPVIQLRLDGAGQNQPAHAELEDAIVLDSQSSKLAANKAKIVSTVMEQLLSCETDDLMGDSGLLLDESGQDIADNSAGGGSAVMSAPKSKTKIFRHRGARKPGTRVIQKAKAEAARKATTDAPATSATATKSHTLAIGVGVMSLLLTAGGALYFFFATPKANTQYHAALKTAESLLQKAQTSSGDIDTWQQAEAAYRKVLALSGHENDDAALKGVNTALEAKAEALATQTRRKEEFSSALAGIEQTLQELQAEDSQETSNPGAWIAVIKSLDGFRATYSDLIADSPFDSIRKTAESGKSRAVDLQKAEHLKAEGSDSLKSGKFEIAISRLLEALAIRNDSDTADLLIRARNESAHKNTPKELVLNVGSEADTASLKLIRIDAGRFIMGSPLSESGRGTDEEARPATVEYPFYIAVTETTQQQYQAVMGTAPGRFKGPTRPVTNLDWTDTAAFCKSLSKQSKRIVRLPYETEWEYASRAGTSGTFHFSGGAPFRDRQQLVVADGREGFGSGPKGVFLGQTMPVGVGCPANAWGLFNMHGNVREWCADPVPGAGERYVMRGGSWKDPLSACRAAARVIQYKRNKDEITGFRIVIEIPDAK